MIIRNRTTKYVVLGVIY